MIRPAESQPIGPNFTTVKLGEVLNSNQQLTTPKAVVERKEYNYAKTAGLPRCFKYPNN
jgi:hypothetical protein